MLRTMCTIKNCIVVGGFLMRGNKDRDCMPQCLIMFLRIKVLWEKSPVISTAFLLAGTF